MKVCIEKLDYEGRGIAHVQNKIVFIPRALPEEVVDIEITKDKKTFSFGKINKIIEKNKNRTLSFCPYASLCGGCTFDIVSYEKSLQYKKEMVKELIKRNLLETFDFEIVPSRPVLEYRNKVNLHVKDYSFGYYEEESHSFVKIKKCLLLNPKINEILEHFSWYSFEEGSLTIRVNAEEEILLIIDTPNEIKINALLTEKFKIAGILLNGKCVYKKPFFEEKRKNVTYLVHANSFFQVNPYISNCMLEEVEKRIQKEDIVFDLYCGCGFFTFPIAEKAKKVIGVEINPSSLIYAEKQRQEQKKTNISFHVGKVEDVFSKLKIRPTKVLVDPPRSGLDKKVLNFFLEKKIETIIYISCNPKTLVRDIKILEEKYSIKEWICFDMFPYTKHIECFCILKLKENL